ncbi:YceI family protein [Solitalea lacus]|uniref:YceI family protein n=1 Tax=Solitalea lacus TaxID=2911172 RepID=UPI001EDAAEA9|nr:YceI family protein [Solitalea lacus]UKJ08025.1 YceI family protein [Solitalea lacus]
MRKFLLLFFVVFSIGSTKAIAQQSTYKLAEKESKIFIHGTSSVHDWTALCDQRLGSVSLTIEKNRLKSLQTFSLSIKAKSIRSIDEKGAYYDDVMDGRIWKALEIDKFSDITISLKQIKAIKPVADKAEVDVIALVTIHGVKKEVPVKIVVETIGSSIKVSGKKQIKMLDYGVQPPTILLEFLKTGNEIIIDFELFFK